MGKYPENIKTSTRTRIDIMVPRISNRELTVGYQCKPAFTCGSFMRNIYGYASKAWADSSVQRGSLIFWRDDKDYNLTPEIVDWWFKFVVKTFSIDIKYLGKENDENVAFYRIPDKKYDKTYVRLMHFTLPRLAWITPYNTMIAELYSLKDSEFIKEHGILTTFQLLHAELSMYGNYSSTFGLTSGFRYMGLTDEEFIEYVNNPQKQFHRSSINGLFNKYTLEASMANKGKSSKFALEYRSPEELLKILKR